MKTSKNLLSILTAGIILSASVATAANYKISLGADTQDLISQNMTKKIHQAMRENIADPALSGEIQNAMMTIISDTVKSSTAARKRAAVVKSCMECRVGKPLKVVISGQVDILDADTQTQINQNMAAVLEETIREKSSDPAVAGLVLEKMMGERMQVNFLREKMQPIMAAKMLGLSDEEHLAQEEEVHPQSPDTASIFRENQPQS
ncbi:MAG: hypothetical protein D3923_03410 [Candidatus Electrothrix sp. AR3]|nr:hypothetical protein [Candidatus Electrothrix sp. AR3]